MLKRYWNSCWWPGTLSLLHYVVQLHLIQAARRPSWPRVLKPTDSRVLYLLLMCFLPCFRTDCSLFLLYKTPQVPNRPILKSESQEWKYWDCKHSFFSSTICTHQKQNVKWFMTLKRHFSFLCYRYRARIMRSTNRAEFQRTPEGKSMIQEKCNGCLIIRKYISQILSEVSALQTTF